MLLYIIHHSEEYVNSTEQRYFNNFFALKLSLCTTMHNIHYLCIDFNRFYCFMRVMHKHV